MGSENLAARITAVAVALRAVDELQGLSKDSAPPFHHLDKMEPLAAFFDALAEQIGDGGLYGATKAYYRLLVALDKSKTLDVSAVERSEMARKLGEFTSSAKSAAAKRNGALGGRPRKDGKPARRVRLSSLPSTAQT